MAAKVIQLRLGGADAEVDLYGDVQELEVQELADGPTTFRLVLSLDRTESGAWPYLEDDRLAPFAPVEVGIGVGGGDPQLGAAAPVERLVDGYVSDVTVRLGERPGDAAVEITGMDATLLMDLEEKVASWPNVTDAQIAEQIHARYGILVETTPTQPLRREADTTVLQRGSDAAFVRSLARRNGFEWRLRPGIARAAGRFGPPKLDGSPQPDLAVQFGDESNLSALTVHVSGTRPLVVQAGQLDPRSKSDATASAREGSLRPLGRRPLDDVASPLDRLVTPAQANGLMLLEAAPSADTVELQTASQAVRDEAGWFISAEGEVDADAYGHVLRSGGLVMVKGAGDAHSGAYYVTRVRHRVVSGGGYRQQFTARRNARDIEGGDGAASQLLGAVSALLG